MEQKSRSRLLAGEGESSVANPAPHDHSENGILKSIRGAARPAGSPSSAIPGRRGRTLCRASSGARSALPSLARQDPRRRSRRAVQKGPRRSRSGTAESTAASGPPAVRVGPASFRRQGARAGGEKSACNVLDGPGRAGPGRAGPGRLGPAAQQRSCPGGDAGRGGRPVSESLSESNVESLFRVAAQGWGPARRWPGEKSSAGQKRERDLYGKGVGWAQEGQSNTRTAAASGWGVMGGRICCRQGKGKGAAWRGCVRARVRRRSTRVCGD